MWRMTSIYLESQNPKKENDCHTVWKKSTTDVEKVTISSYVAKWLHVLSTQLFHLMSQGFVSKDFHLLQMEGSPIFYIYISSSKRLLDRTYEYKESIWKSTQVSFTSSTNL